MSRIIDKLDKILEGLPLPCDHPAIPLDAFMVSDAESAARMEQARRTVEACPKCKDRTILVLDISAKNSQEMVPDPHGGQASLLRYGNLEIGLNYDRGSKNGGNVL